MKIIGKDGYINTFHEMKEKELEKYLQNFTNKTGKSIEFNKMQIYKSLYGLEQKEFIYKIV